jgi:GNAT superfamily N-acetyltransferase
MPYRIEFSADPSPADLQVVTDGLLAPAVPEAERPAYLPLAFFVRDDAGAIIGGVIGNTGGPWLYVSALWVAEEMRGRRLGSRLMDAAERMAVRRGCTGAYLDTLAPGALAFYRARGYELFGELDGFPGGRMRCFLRKALIAPGERRTDAPTGT